MHNLFNRLGFSNVWESKESATCEQVVRLLTDVTDSLEVRNSAIPEDIQANVQPLDQPSPYGDNHGMEAPVPVLMQPMGALSTALTPSAFPRVLKDQALRSHIFQPQQEDQVNQGPATNPELKTANDFVALTEVDHRARHMAQPGFDQCSLIEHSDRWNKVDTQAKRHVTSRHVTPRHKK